MLSAKLSYYYPSSRWSLDGDEYAGLTWDGEDMPSEQGLADLPWPPAPTLADYRHAIQAYLNAKAQERNYDDGHTIATYINSTVEPWAAEAQAFVAWRDAVWVYAFSEMAKVESGQRSAPSPEEFCSELPPFNWPE